MNLIKQITREMLKKSARVIREQNFRKDLEDLMEKFPEKNFLYIL